MMFPDTSNEMQRAALRFAAERFHSAGNSPDQHANEAEKNWEQVRKRFPARTTTPTRPAEV